jgi:hypothetical protein
VAQLFAGPSVRALAALPQPRRPAAPTAPPTGAAFPPRTPPAAGYFTEAEATEAAAAEAAAAEAESAAAAAAAAAESPLQLVTLKPGAAGALPLVLVHAAGASALSYQALANALDPRTPVIAVDDASLYDPARYQVRAQYGLSTRPPSTTPEQHGFMESFLFISAV